MLLLMMLALPLLATLIAATSEVSAPFVNANAIEASATTPIVEPATTFDHSHGALTRVLSKYVKKDRVAYRALKEERAALDDYIASLEGLTAPEFAAWSREQKYAFWINVYNAYTLKVVIDHYPVKSIRDIKEGSTGVWDLGIVDLAELASGLGQSRLSLNDVEHKILREEFKDARVHAAVNCASVGCPPLAARAFTAEGLDEMLTQQVRTWLADSARNRVVREKNCLEISKIFEWFASDFERDAGGVRQWIAKYAPADVGEWLEAQEKVKIQYLDYSWDLNETK